MDPNQPQQPSYSIDYLNQIAPQQTKRRFLSNKQLIIGGILGVVILVVVVMSIILNAGSTTQSSQQLAARLQSTETIVGDANSAIKSSQLRALNSSLKIFLTNANRDIAAPLLRDGITVTKIDKKVIAAEVGTDITDRLEDARLNAVYDRTYAREIAYRLQTIITLMRSLYESTRNEEFKTFLSTAYTNLEPTQKAFAEFNSVNE